MDEPTVLEASARIDDHMLDAAVTRPQLRLEVPNSLAGFECRKNLRWLPRVDVKLGHAVPDVLVGFVSEKFQLRCIRANDDPVAVDPLHADSGVLEEIA